MRMAMMIAAIALSASVGTASVAVAAEPCRPTARSIDPAFAGPDGCVRAPAPKPDAAKKGWTTTPDGKRVWSDGSTSLSVSGSVGFDVTTGNARVTPSR